MRRAARVIRLLQLLVVRIAIVVHARSVRISGMIATVGIRGPVVGACALVGTLGGSRKITRVFNDH